MNPVSNVLNKNVLFFSTNNFIWPYVYTEALVAEALKNSGFSVTRATCSGILKSYCTSFGSLRLPVNTTLKEKNKICKVCRKKRDIIKKEFSFNEIEIDSYIDKNDVDEANRILNIITPENYYKYTLDDIEIGRLSLYEVLLAYKKSALDMHGEEWDLYKAYFKSTLFSYFFAKKYFSKNKTHALFVFASLYPTNAVVMKVADKLSIKTYFMNPGTNLSEYKNRILMGPEFSWRQLKDTINFWNKNKDIYINPENYSCVTNHFIELLKAESLHVFSSKKSNNNFNVLEYFNIPESHKLVVCAMSSYDERFAVESVGAFKPTENLLFKDQAEWIKFVIEWASDKKDISVIIRVHPREFPNRTDNVLSEHAQKLMNLFKNLPKNVHVNWPTDNISVYDIALQTDLFLSAWSSVGKEMPLLGLPVVIFSEKLIVYPGALNLVGETKEKYLDHLESALKTGWSFDYVVNAYRWLAFEYSDTQIKIREPYLIKTNHKNNFLTKAYRRIYSKFLWKRKLIHECRQRNKNYKPIQVISKIVSENHDSILNLIEIKKDHNEIETRNFILQNFKKIIHNMSNNDMESFFCTKLGKNIQMHINHLGDC